MRQLQTSVHALAAFQDKDGEPDVVRVDRLARTLAVVCTLFSTSYLTFSLWRLCASYDKSTAMYHQSQYHHEARPRAYAKSLMHFELSDVDRFDLGPHEQRERYYEYYYGTLGCVAAQVGVQGIATAFAFILCLGTLKKQQSHVVLWILSTFVLIAVETAILVYTNATRTRSHVKWDAWAKAELFMYILKLATHVPTLTIAAVFYRNIDDIQVKAAEERQFLL